MSNDDDIKTTYLESTRGQRRLWVNLMARETERTGERLKLSDWIIRHLPQPGIDYDEFVSSVVEYPPDDLPYDFDDIPEGDRYFAYMDSVLITEQADGSFLFSDGGIDHVADDRKHLEELAYKYYLRVNM